MTETETPEPDDRSLLRRISDIAPAVATSTITGAADLALFGSPSFGAMAPLAEVLLRRAIDARVCRGERVLKQAAERVGGRDRLIALTTADEARLELTDQVFEAGMRTVREQKIRALGRVLANGLDGHATVDESQILAPRSTLSRLRTFRFSLCCATTPTSKAATSRHRIASRR